MVTVWTSGCTQNKALELSGFGPGDLIRALNRALDALQQLGNLPINPARSMGNAVHKGTPDIHLDICRLCKGVVRDDRWMSRDSRRCCCWDSCYAHRDHCRPWFSHEDTVRNSSL